MKCFCGNRSGEGDRGGVGIAQFSLETTAGDMFMWQWEWRERGRKRIELCSKALNTTAGEVFPMWQRGAEREGEELRS